MLNARTVRAWLTERLGPDAVAKHMVAVRWAAGARGTCLSVQSGAHWCSSTTHAAARMFGVAGCHRLCSGEATTSDLALLITAAPT